LDELVTVSFVSQTVFDDVCFDVSFGLRESLLNQSFTFQQTLELSQLVSAVPFKQTPKVSLQYCNSTINQLDRVKQPFRLSR
jgi:hypothetical protein